MAQSASIGAPVSAHIIPLPTAAAAPVQQKRRPGRHPKEIVNLRRYKTAKRSVDHRTYLAREDMEAIRIAIAIGEKHLHEMRYRLALLAQKEATHV